MLKKIALFLSFLFLLSACGGGGSTKNEDSGVTDSNKYTPNAVKLVGATALSTTALNLEWLPSADDKTAPDNLVYEVHISTDENFKPSLSSKKRELKGEVFTDVSGLIKNTKYYVMIAAVDEDGNQSWGNKLQVNTLSKDFKVKNVDVVIQSENEQPVVDDNLVTFKSNNNQLPEKDDFISSVVGDGYLRKVVSTTESNGEVSAMTTNAALNEVYEDLQISMTILMEDLPESSNKRSVAAKTLESTSKGTPVYQSNVTNDVSWKSGLTLSSFNTKGTNHPSNKSLSQRSAKLLVKTSSPDSSEVVKSEGHHMSFSMPSYFVVAPREILSLPFEFKTGSGICVKNCYVGVAIYDIPKVCDVTLDGFTHPDGGKESISNPVVFNNSGAFSSGWTPLDEQLDGEPYVATYEAKIGTKDQCDNGKYEETLSIEIPIYVAKGNPSVNFNSSNVPYGQENGITVDSGFDIDFDPTLTINAEISNASLKSAEFSLAGLLKIDQFIDIEAIGSNERVIGSSPLC